MSRTERGSKHAAFALLHSRMPWKSRPEHSVWFRNSVSVTGPAGDRSTPLQCCYLLVCTTDWSLAVRRYYVAVEVVRMDCLLFRRQRVELCSWDYSFIEQFCIVLFFFRLQRSLPTNLHQQWSQRKAKGSSLTFPSFLMIEWRRC